MRERILLELGKFALAYILRMLHKRHRGDMDLIGTKFEDFLKKLTKPVDEFINQYNQEKGAN